MRRTTAVLALILVAALLPAAAQSPSTSAYRLTFDPNKVIQAKKAGGVFFDKLPAKAECGLIIFDHELRLIKPPTKNRTEIRRDLEAAEPGGGTAYLDAAAKSIELLKKTATKGKVAVVM